MKNIGPNLTVVIAVIGFLFAGLGYLRWAKSESAVNTIKLLNDEIGALKLQNARLEGDNKVLVGKLDEQTERLALLQSLVMGVPAWDRLQQNYASLEKAIKSLEPVIAVFQKHVDEQDEMYRWLKALKERAERSDEPAAA